MATRVVLTPYSAEFPATDFPQLALANRRPVLLYSNSTQQTAYWTIVAPQGITGTWTAVISYATQTVTSGGVAFDVAVEAITSGDALDTDAATGFDSVNAGNDGTVPGTAGYLEQISITLTNMDSVAAADYLRISVARDVADAADTAAEAIRVFAVEIRDGA